MPWPNCWIAPRCLIYLEQPSSLQWCHNEHDGVSNHQPHDCLLHRLFRQRWKKTSKLRVTGLCEGNSPVTGEFPAERASNVKMFPFDDVIMFQENKWTTSKELSTWFVPFIFCYRLVRALICLCVYTWRLLHWGQGNLTITIVPVQVKQAWRIWLTHSAKHWELKI